MSVKKQLLCYFFIFMIFVLLPFLFFPKIFEELRLDYAKKEAENQVNLFQNGLTMTMLRNQYVADNLAFFFEHYDGELTKELIVEHLKERIGNDKFSDVYGGTVCFIPGKTPFGKYAPYFYKKKKDKGYELAFMDLALSKHDYSKRNWFQASLDAGGFPIWSYPYDDIFSGNEFMVTYSAPVMRNGELVAFVTVDILIDKLREMFLDDYAGDGDYCFILTPDNSSIGIPGDPKPMSKISGYMSQNYDEESLTILKNALEDWKKIFEAKQIEIAENKSNFSDIKEYFFMKDHRYRAFIDEDKFIGKKSIYSIVPMMTPGVLLVAVTSESKLFPHFYVVQHVAFISILIIMTAFLLIFYFSGKAAEPFEELVNQSEEFAGGNFENRIDLKNAKSMGLFNSSKEVSKLVDAFNSMGESLRKSFDELSDTRQEILLKLLRASEYKDTDTAYHLKRIRAYCVLIAEKLGLTDSQVNMIADASMMHDVGKIGIPDNILLKPAKLTDEEFEIMKTHAKVGGDILSGSKSILLQMAEKIASCHHEKWNGKGYPLGLEGKNIPIEARITSVGDVFDALISKRPYKKPWPFEEAIDYIQKERGISLDPEIVDIFINSKDEVRKIVDELT